MFLYGKGLRAEHPYIILPLSGLLSGEKVQWSSDGAYLKFQRPNPRLLGRPTWETVSVDGTFHAYDEEVEGVEWVDRIEPMRLPEFITQEQPQVSREMPIVWGGDSKAVYVYYYADYEGFSAVFAGGDQVGMPPAAWYLSD